MYDLRAAKRSAGVVRFGQTLARRCHVAARGKAQECYFGLLAPRLARSLRSTTRNARHRGEVALGDFLPNEDAALSDVTAERLGEAQQGARNASLYGKRVRGYQRFVGVTEPSREQDSDVTVKVRR